MREQFEIIAQLSVHGYGLGQTIDPRETLRLLKDISQSAHKSADALQHIQSPEGYWCGDLIGDSSLLSNYILLQLWLHPPQDGLPWAVAQLPRIRKLVHSLWASQLRDGGWNIFESGPPEINASVLAYTALKLAGEDTNSPHMKKARRLILQLGGLQACNSYTKLNLSFFGLFPRQFVPTVPPEILIIPGNVLYEMSSWTRTIIVPLSIIQAQSVQRPTPLGMMIDELFHPHTKVRLPKKDRISEVFVQADRLLKQWEQRGMKKIRAKAVRAAEHWMLAHMQNSEGLGAIYPAMMYSIMAMDALGYEHDQPDLALAIRQFEDLFVDDGDTVRFQPCKSPVWDTAIAIFALGEMGLGASKRMARAADWLLTREVRRKGDWSEKRPDLTPSGWAFEFANESYPDIDDTAMVLLALQHAKATDPEQQARSEQRAINWLLGMQSSDGGWAAFDVDNDWQILNKIPFADHNAMLDPTCADITGRVLECLCRRGMTCDDPAIRSGVEYLLTTQEESGRWYGRWGVNYIYGTFLALRGLRAAGDPAGNSAMHRACDWLVSVQNEDGGWGESCQGYLTSDFCAAESTPSQTAWALLGLIAAGHAHSPAVRAGFDWLVQHQRPDGTWDEKLTTGTGFPNVFYLSYSLYRNYFPLMAMAAFRKTAEKLAVTCSERNSGRQPGK